MLQQEGYIIIQVDEAIFQPNRYHFRHWAPVNNPIRREFRNQPGETRAVIAGICAEFGLIHTFQKDSTHTGLTAVDIKRFLCNLQDKIYKLIPHKKVAIFWDNLRAHMGITTEIRNGDEPYLRFIVVKNIPYRPDLNGIENYWTAVKRQYRLKTD